MGVHRIAVCDTDTYLFGVAEPGWEDLGDPGEEFPARDIIGLDQAKDPVQCADPSLLFMDRGRPRCAVCSPAGDVPHSEHPHIFKWFLL